MARDLPRSALPGMGEFAASPRAEGVRVSQRASLYRMVTKDHVCPYGIKSKWLLRRQGFEVQDHLLTSREQTDAFKRAHDVETTPQTFIGERRVGGYDDLRRLFGKRVHESGETSYQPVIAVFACAALVALATHFSVFQTIYSTLVIQWFVALVMLLLAMLKLQDLGAFSTMFLTYDLLAQRWVPYAYIYPFAEALAGVLMLAGIAPFFSAPLALFIGGVGAASVIKTVWVDRRDVKCACVGGNSKVPLGFVSLTENVAMVTMGIWMGVRALG